MNDKQTRKMYKKVMATQTKVKSKFIHEVIANNCKITPKFFYWAKLVQAAKDQDQEIWQVSRTGNDNVYCRADLKFLIDDESQIERLGLYNSKGQKY